MSIDDFIFYGCRSGLELSDSVNCCAVTFGVTAEWLGVLIDGMSDYDLARIDFEVVPSPSGTPESIKIRG